jgi:hypothetical protein
MQKSVSQDSLKKNLNTAHGLKVGIMSIPQPIPEATCPTQAGKGDPKGTLRLQQERGEMNEISQSFAD